MALDTEGGGDPPRRVHLLCVDLPVAHGEREEGMPLGPDEGGGRVGVEAAAQQDDGTPGPGAVRQPSVGARENGVNEVSRSYTSTSSAAFSRFTTR